MTEGTIMLPPANNPGDMLIRLVVGHRYLFKQVHVDGDVPYEASIEEIAPSQKWIKLRHFPGGTYEWKEIDNIAVYEELPTVNHTKEKPDGQS